MLFLSMARPGSAERIYNKNLAIELRLDLFHHIDIECVNGFLQNSANPVMLTVRKISQGGEFQGNESERETLIKELLALEPPFFDLEYDMNPQFLQEVIKNHPKTKIILSYHNFQRVPTDLSQIYSIMREYAVYGYKIAVMTHSTNDALNMLLLVKKHPKTSAICMGEQGRFARILGPISGNFIGYASVHSEEKTGPGQLTVSELIDIYRYLSLNKESSIYGLIGNPVEKSPGHLYHNEVFRKRGMNAVYVKMIVKPEELSEFISLAKEIGIRGLSVTMPLKEKILPFLDEIEPAAQQIGAVNTLLFKNGKVIGANTDGIGALDAIEKRGLVRGKKIVLLGAGGAARGIAYEAKVRGADVLVLNRTVQRAKELAADLGCEAGSLDEVPNDYDILINCSPDSMPIDPKKIRADTMAMDVVYFPRETDFLKAAVLKRCQIVYGEEMFLNQAARQTAFWMDA